MKCIQKLLLLLATCLFINLNPMNPQASGATLDSFANAFATGARGLGDMFKNGVEGVANAVEKYNTARQARIDAEIAKNNAARAALEGQEATLVKNIAQLNGQQRRTPNDEALLVQYNTQLTTTRKKLEELDKKNELQQKKMERGDALQEKAMQNMIDYANLGPELLRESALAEVRIREASAKASAEVEGKKAAARAAIEEFFTNFTQPKNVALTGAYALTIFGAYYGLKFGAQVLEDWYRIPSLADKTTILSAYRHLYNWFFNIDVFSATRDDIILDPDTEAFFNEYIEATKNTLANGGYLRSLLLPGPSGTGKTLMSMVLANELELPAIYFAASNLRNYKVEDAITKLRQLFSYAEHSSKPVVIIIDESEVIFASRDKSTLSEETRMVMNEIMAKTGTEQCNFILIALTNRPQDFDSAFQSRFSEMIYINPPTILQRTNILSMYIDKYLVHPIFEVKSGWFRKQAPKPITIEEGLFTPESITELSKQLDTFTGRDISQLVMAIRDAAMATKNIHLTKDMTNRVIQRKIDKKQKELKLGITAPAA